MKELNKVKKLEKVLLKNRTNKKRLEYVVLTLFTGQSSKEGIFMKYSYEFKKECVESYREGKWPDTTKGVDERLNKSIQDEGIFSKMKEGLEHDRFRY